MKRSTLILLSLLLLAGFSAQGQFLERTVFSTAGDDATIGIWHYDYTFGEPIIGTVFSTSPIMTMGFQQPLLLGPLQAELLHFTAELEGEDGVLKWALREPLWPGKFTVQRSEDGQNFLPLAEVDGLERSDEGYGYTDFQVARQLSERAYYRLQLSGPDGRVSNSKIVELRWNNPEEDLLLFPNPAHDFIQVQWTHSTQAVFRLYDLAGRLLQQKEANGQTALMEIAQLPAGTYLVEAMLGGQTFRKKFVKR